MTSAISVITVSYYTGPTLWLTIASALQQPECLECIVVNNGNTAVEEQRLRDWMAKEPRLKLLSGHGNVGFGAANNLGVAQARGDYVLLLNPDSLLPEGGLAALLADMANRPENTLAGCYLVNPDGSEQRGGRRALLTPVNGIAESLGLSRFLKKSDNLNYNMMAMPEHTHEVPVISGAFMFLAKSFYQRLGGFDEGYFLHMEDTDFCYRVHKAGGKVICIPAVKVLHFRSTSEVTSAFIEKHKAKGFIRYLNKHFSSQYPSFLLKLMAWGIHFRLRVKIIMGRIDSVFVSPIAGKQEVAAMALLHELTRFGPQDNSLTGKTILVTGAASQIGLCVIGMALAKGADVVALYHHSHPVFFHPRLQWRKGNLAKTKKLAALRDVRADTMIYAAPLEYLARLLTVLEEVKRIIVIGSGLPLTETEADQEKEILQLCAGQSRDATVLNPLLPYGVGLDKNVTPLANVIKRFGFVPIYGAGQGLRNPVQVRDAAAAVFAVLANSRTYGKSYNLGGGSKVTYMELLQQLSAYIGASPRLIKIPFMPFILGALGRIYQLDNVDEKIAERMNRDISFDNSEAMEDFDFMPKAFLDGNITV